MEKYSKKERLMLSNQYEILARLTDDEYEKKQYENLSEIFKQGYSWGYSLATEPFVDELSHEECRFVIDVLNMYSTLYYSRENSDEPMEYVEEKKVLFKGFDLNDAQECRYLSFYRFLVEDLERFEEFKEWIDNGKIEDFNSHGFGPSMDGLERMIQKKKELDVFRRERHDMYFTEEEINEILNA